MNGTRESGDADDSVLSLSRYLAIRLGPLALLLLFVVSVSAPVAYLVVGTDAVRQRADATAQQLARSVLREMHERPILWRYDANKIAASLEVHRAQPEVRRIEIVDERGRLVDLGLGGPDEEGPLLWAVAPVIIDEVTVAQVWVGTSADEVETHARWLLLAFVALGGSLAGVIYWLPLRTMEVAERRVVELVDRLQRSQGELAELNSGLEEEVARRSSQLESALARVREKELNLRELSRRSVTIEEVERRALARELHDSAGQTMTAIRINAQLMASLAGEDGELAAMAARNVELIDTTLEEMRRILERLAPAVLDDLGLEEAIERLCVDFTERFEVPVSLDIAGLEGLTRRDGAPAGGGGVVGSGVEKAIYRLMQEALTNVARHARATRVEVRIVRIGESVDIVVHDDGVGFDVEEAVRRGRRGLAGMRERVELLGGEFELDSRPGAGTRVHVSLRVAPDPPPAIRSDPAMGSTG